jgi:hypothetical protein
MVKIELPTNIAEVIADAEAERQRMAAKALIQELDLEKKIEAAMDAQGFKQKVLSALKAEIQSRVQRFIGQPGFNPGLFRSSIHRPSVGLIAPGGEYVTSVAQLTEVIEKIECFRKETLHNNTELILGKIPEGYIGRIAYLYKKHIPQFAYEKDLVVSKRFQEKTGGTVSWFTLCRDIPPASTNRSYFETPVEEIEDTYGWITFKVISGKLVGWFVGIDQEQPRPSGESYDLVLVGAHFKKNQKSDK